MSIRTQEKRVILATNMRCTCGAHTHLEEVSFPKRMFAGIGRKFHQLPSLSSSSATYHAPQRQLSTARGGADSLWLQRLPF